jgi:hypothetical protein
VDAAAEEFQRRVQVDANPDVRAGGPDGVVDEVQVLDRVDHQGDPGGSLFVAGELAECIAVGGRVADDDVLVVGRQQQGFGQGERKDAAIPGTCGDAPDQGTAADRLAGQADGGGAAGPGRELGGVAVERVEVDDGERRFQVFGRLRELGHAQLVRGFDGGAAVRGRRGRQEYRHGDPFVVIRGVRAPWTGGSCRRRSAAAACAFPQLR